MKRPRKKGHELLIICFSDAQAECTCGKWYYEFTGRLTEKEIINEYKKHLKNVQP